MAITEITLITIIFLEKAFVIRLCSALRSLLSFYLSSIPRDFFTCDRFLCRSWRDAVVADLITAGHRRMDRGDRRFMFADGDYRTAETQLLEIGQSSERPQVSDRCLAEVQLSKVCQFNQGRQVGGLRAIEAQHLKIY